MRTQSFREHGSGVAKIRHDSDHSVAFQPSHLSHEDGKRYSELDGLRGLASISVVLFHVNERWLPLGWAAVDLFFVMSGFLITQIILKNGTEPGFLTRFYLRRGVRIWPIYYLTLVALMIFSRALPTRCNWSGLWYALTYTQNLPVYWGGKNPIFHPSIRHTWIALATLALTWGFRLAGGSIYLLAGRLDGLALGGLLAGLQMQAPGMLTNRMTRFSSLTGLLGLLALQQTGRLDIHATGPWPSVLILLVNLTAFGGVGLLIQQAGSPWLAPLRLRPLQIVGQMSYGLYLYHGILLAIAVGSSRLPSASHLPLPQLIATLSLCLALSTLSWVYIERPLLRLKDRWPYRRQSKAVESTPRPHAAAKSGQENAHVWQSPG